MRLALERVGALLADRDDERRVPGLRRARVTFLTPFGRAVETTLWTPSFQTNFSLSPTLALAVLFALPLNVTPERVTVTVLPCDFAVAMSCRREAEDSHHRDHCYKCPSHVHTSVDCPPHCGQFGSDPPFSRPSKLPEAGA